MPESKPGKKLPVDVVELTREMVRIPSENPDSDESAMLEFVKNWLDENGIEYEILPVEGVRSNLIARLPGEGKSPPLALLAHMDTVPIGDRASWQHDPFGAELEDGKIYGRGSCDMKGGLACALLSLKSIKEAGVKLAGDLLVVCTVDEEVGMSGIHAIHDKASLSNDTYLMALEPTSCRLKSAHKGVFWYKAEMFGLGAHAANPQFGHDANRAIAGAITGWYDLVDIVLPQVLEKHPQLDYPTLVVSKLEGGVKTNIVSEYCQVEIDVRVPPTITAEKIEQYIKEIGQKAAQEQNTTFAINVINELRLPVECRSDSPLLAAFRQAYKKVTGQETELQGFVGYTDAAMLAMLTGNQHSVVFGPGHFSDAHTTDEKVEIEQLELALKILYQTILELLA